MRQGGRRAKNQTGRLIKSTGHIGMGDLGDMTDCPCPEPKVDMHNKAGSDCAIFMDRTTMRAVDAVTSWRPRQTDRQSRDERGRSTHEIIRGCMIDGKMTPTRDGPREEPHLQRTVSPSPRNVSSADSPGDEHERSCHAQRQARPTAKAKPIFTSG